MRPATVQTKLLKPLFCAENGGSSAPESNVFRLTRGLPFARDSRVAAALPIQDQQSKLLARRMLKLGVVFGLHAGLILVVVQHAPSHQLPEPDHIPIEVRMIEVPPPSRPAALLIPRPVAKLPKPAPPATRPVVYRPQPGPQPVVLAAAPAAPASTPSVAAFADAPQPTVQLNEAASAVPPAPPAPAPTQVATTTARFDADYLQNPAPDYPFMSRKLREVGEILLHVNVTAGGMAEQVQIKQGSGFPRLDQAALNAVRNWRFVPARRGDQAVAASVVVPITFRLDS